MCAFATRTNTTKLPVFIKTRSFYLALRSSSGLLGKLKPKTYSSSVCFFHSSFFSLGNQDSGGGSKVPPPIESSSQKIHNHTVGELSRSGKNNDAHNSMRNSNAESNQTLKKLRNDIRTVDLSKKEGKGPVINNAEENEIEKRARNLNSGSLDYNYTVSQKSNNDFNSCNGGDNISNTLVVDYQNEKINQSVGIKPKFRGNIPNKSSPIENDKQINQNAGINIKKSFETSFNRKDLIRNNIDSNGNFSLKNTYTKSGHDKVEINATNSHLDDIFQKAFDYRNENISSKNEVNRLGNNALHKNVHMVGKLNGNPGVKDLNKKFKSSSSNIKASDDIIGQINDKVIKNNGITDDSSGKNMKAGDEGDFLSTNHDNGKNNKVVHCFHKESQSNLKREISLEMPQVSSEKTIRSNASIFLTQEKPRETSIPQYSRDYRGGPRSYPSRQVDYDDSRDYNRGSAPFPKPWQSESSSLPQRDFSSSISPKIQEPKKSPFKQERLSREQPYKENSAEHTSFPPLLESLTNPSFPSQTSAFGADIKQDIIPPRHDPILSHVTNMIMRDGKKTIAKAILNDALHIIQIQTHSNPVEILHAAIETASPLVRVISQRKGVKVIQVPGPLNERQRHHRAIKWIIEASDKRPEKSFGVRFGMEILAVINGVSKVLEKKNQVHKLAVANRANLPIKW
ncbi:hypothetical protein G9A89_000415 [Geosiphon pyriformis]|nr:hypothetical protein G9A89_000415 [Geosiphon pyriformis]